MDLMMLVPHAPVQSDHYLKHVPCTTHNCEVPAQEDELLVLIKGSNLTAKLRRWLHRKCILSREHPATRTCMKSTSAVNYEISRHINFYPWMIHPFSLFRSFWEMIMTFVSLIALIITPFVITFYFEGHEEWTYVILLIDIIFLCDIILWFFTGYYEYHTKVVTLDPKIVVFKYLKTFFALDLLSAVPLELIGILIPVRGKCKWYYKSLNILKIIRLRTIVIYGQRLRHTYRITFQTYKIFEICMVLMLSIHWAACLEYYVPLIVSELISPHKNYTPWILTDRMKNKETKFKKYVACLNRAAITLVCSAHYSDVKAMEDIILNIILTIIGRFGIIYLLAQFLQLMTTFRSTSKKHLRLLHQMHEYSRYKELPYDIQRRILAYCNYYNRRNLDVEKNIINQVSSHLQQKMLLHNYKRLTENVECLQYLPPQVISQLAMLIRSEIYLANDLIIEAGTSGDALHFIVSGTVAVYTSTGQEICHLKDGAHFGEITLIMDNEHYVTSIIAIEPCEFYILTRADFRQVLTHYPNLLNDLRRMALERLERSFVLDEA